ncbi:hypothetical protein ILUMI_19080, partial [Ignelater luminosus]
YVNEFYQAFSLVPQFQVVLNGPLVCAEILAALEEAWGLFTIMNFGNFNNDVSDIVRCLEALCGFVQVLAKVVVLVYYNCNFITLLENTKLFWDTSGCDERFQEEMYSIRSLTTPLLLIIQNSQAAVIIKAGDLITINAETVMKVLRVAWSGCSLARGIKQN